MKAAYILLAHKNPAQVKRLIERLNNQPCEIFLHLDLGMPAARHQEFLDSLQGIANIHLLHRHFTNWGSIRLVLATLEGVRAVLSDAPDCEYALLISGQDYPIQPLTRLYDFLERSQGNSYLEYSPLPNPIWRDHGGWDRINSWHYDFAIRNNLLRVWVKNKVNHLLNILRPKRKFLPGYQPFGGAQWWCLQRRCLEHVIHTVRCRPDILRYFSAVRIPDELFFHTLLLNSPLRQSIINRKLTYVDWDGPPYPRVLRSDDLPSLTASDCFFARKFDMTVDIKVMESLASTLSIKQQKSEVT